MKYLALFLLCSLAHAEVLVCTDQACATRTGKPLASMQPDDLVRYCAGIPTKGSSDETTCKPAGELKTFPWKELQPYSWALTSDGWLTKGTIPATSAPPPQPTFVYVPPKCFSLTEAKWKWERTQFMASIWCEHADGIKWSGRVYQLTGSPKVADAPITSEDVMSLDRKLTTRTLTQAEMDALNEFSLTFAPIAKVVNSTVGGVVVGPPKYERNTNNTAGKSAGRATKDQKCEPWLRLVDATGNPTSYYKLAGEDFYARCSVTGKYVKLP